MDNIYRFKKRMVFPEKLTMTQPLNKPTASSPLQSGYTNDVSNNAHENYKCTSSRSHTSEESDTPISINKQFIQDRIRHLVEAFSTRTQVARERIEHPATPSSISSRESVASCNSKRYRNSTSSDHSLEIVSQTEMKNNSFFKKIREFLDFEAIDPNSKSYIFWMLVAALTVLYNAWVIPLRSTFPYQSKENCAIWMTFDYLADLIYLIDIVIIQPRVKYLNEGFWVTDTTQLRQNYIKSSRFKMDVLALLPLDLFYIWLGPNWTVLRFPRYFKLHTFWEFISFVDKRLSNPYIIRITRTLMYMMFLIHLNACAYYAFSKWEGIGSNNFVYNGIGNAYIVCFYFATKTATSIGKNPKPTQDIEYIFMTFSWLMGVFVFALLIGQIRDIISTATRNKTEYRKLVDETLEYIRRLNLPQDIQRRVQLWFNYTWETQHTLDENTIMDCLPHKMKTDIAINVHIQTLSKVKLFADCDEALLRELVLQLKSVIYLPGDIICKKGDVGKEMYIIQSGNVHVIGGRNNSEVLATLSEGSVFGEISLLGIPGMNRRTADVRSQGYSNLFVLSKADLNAAVSQYPEAQELLNKKAKILIKKNAALEGKRNAIIVIDNPTPPPKQAKLLETVLQVLPPDSQSNKLLRYGSRGKPRREPKNDIFKYRNSLPSIGIADNLKSTFETEVIVHRTMN